jgi:hypothetical protein
MNRLEKNQQGETATRQRKIAQGTMLFPGDMINVYRKLYLRDHPWAKELISQCVVLDTTVDQVTVQKFDKTNTICTISLTGEYTIFRIERTHTAGVDNDYV